MSVSDPSAGQLDPGNADPEAFAEPLTDAELAEVLGLVDNPDALVTAGLAGTFYDPAFTGPGDPGDLDQEGTADDH